MKGSGGFSKILLLVERVFWRTSLTAPCPTSSLEVQPFSLGHLPPDICQFQLLYVKDLSFSFVLLHSCFNSCSHPPLWSWALGHDQKDKIMKKKMTFFHGNHLQDLQLNFNTAACSCWLIDIHLTQLFQNGHSLVILCCVSVSLRTKASIFYSVFFQRNKSFPAICLYCVLNRLLWTQRWQQSLFSGLYEHRDNHKNAGFFLL